MDEVLKGFTLVEEKLAPASRGVAIHAARGDRLRIVDIEGKQVGDLCAWNTNDPTEYFSPAHTVTQNWRVNLQPGDSLASNLRNAVFTLLADEVGYHDIIVPCCDAEAYRKRYGLANHRHCKGNLEEALAEIGVDYPVQGERAWNMFMKNRIGPEGEMIYEEPIHPAGSSLLLGVEMDVVVALSACPQDQTPTNGWNCSPMRIERWVPKK